MLFSNIICFNLSVLLIIEEIKVYLGNTESVEQIYLHVEITY